jgi:hypothetical protein
MDLVHRFHSHCYNFIHKLFLQFNTEDRMDSKEIK